jgi:hypothetical protein
MAHEAGKGDARRPGNGYNNNYDKIDWSIKMNDETKDRGCSCPCDPSNSDGLTCPDPKTGLPLCA